MRGSIFAEGIGSQRLFGNYVRVLGFLYTWVSEDVLGREQVQEHASFCHIVCRVVRTSGPQERRGRWTGRPLHVSITLGGERASRSAVIGGITPQDSEVSHYRTCESGTSRS